MPAPFTGLIGKVEEAMKSVVTDLALSGVTVNTGFDTSELEAPYVVVTCMGEGEERVWSSGIWDLRAAVTVAANLDDQISIAAHRERYGTVHDAFLDDAIATTLSAAVSDFHCYQVRPISLTQDWEERKILNILELDLTVCGADLV